MIVDRLKVWVLACQSSMEGCGLLQGHEETREGVWSFSSGGAWEMASEPLHRLWESYTPVHQDLMREGGPEWTSSAVPMAVRASTSGALFSLTTRARIAYTVQ